MAGCCLYGAMLMGMFLRKYEIFNSFRLSDAVREDENVEAHEKVARKPLPGLDRFDELAITGMTCASCSNSVESTLMALDGVKRANVNALHGLAQVVYDCTKTQREHLIAAIEDAGFGARSSHSNGSLSDTVALTLSTWNYGEAFTWSLFCLVPILALQTTPTVLVEDRRRQLYLLILSGFAVFGFGLPFHRRAWLAVSRFHALPMDVLVSTATSVAYAADLHSYVSGSDDSYAAMAASLISVVSLGRHLESKAKASISATMHAFTESVPSEACVIQERSNIVVPASMLRKGDLVAVEPGRRFPCDGTLCSPGREGYAERVEINESFHTGEARPVLRGLGDLCLAGTLNSGQLPACVRVKSAEDAIGRLDQILKTLMDSHRYKSGLQTSVESAMTYMVPSILALALASFIVWLRLSNFDHAVRSLVAVLVVACPCALGLSTPAALMIATAVSSKYGIVLKRGAQAVEALAKTSTIAFDKTGTITAGQMTLEQWRASETLPGDLRSEEQWWHLVTAAGMDSSHWAATAIQKYAESAAYRARMESRKPPAERSSLSVVPGRGISCTVDDVFVVIGNEEHLASHGMSGPHIISDIQSLATSESCVLVAFDGCYAGIMAFADRILPDARSAIDNLKARGLRVCMMTGDRESVAAEVAKMVGVETYRSGMTPRAKTDRLRALKAGGETVAMVGDGINDAMALGIADVGIAMHCGAPLAVASADLVLLSSSLQQILPAIDMAKAVHHTIKRNICWAMFYNVLLLPLAAGVFKPWGWTLHPTLGGALMIGSSLGVTYSSMRLEKTLADIFER